MLGPRPFLAGSAYALAFLSAGVVAARPRLSELLFRALAESPESGAVAGSPDPATMRSGGVVSVIWNGPDTRWLLSV